jgi:nitrate reductase NapAB chaperone NapD
MNISGILIIVAPENVDSIVKTLNALNGIDVHHVELSSGRIIITNRSEWIAHYFSS